MGLHRRGDGLISIHAPRVGSDNNIAASAIQVSSFQSTLPVWGATDGCDGGVRAGQFQSTLPVWGATRHPDLRLAASPISIHAPRVGSDVNVIVPAVVISTFQSTLPVWGATPLRRVQLVRVLISIHAPRVGSDSSGLLSP